MQKTKAVIEEQCTVYYILHRNFTMMPDQKHHVDISQDITDSLSQIGSGNGTKYWPISDIIWHHLWSVRDHFVFAPSQWEMMSQCNVVSHWLGAYTKWSLVSELMQEHSRQRDDRVWLIRCTSWWCPTPLQNLTPLLINKSSLKSTHDFIQVKSSANAWSF